MKAQPALKAIQPVVFQNMNFNQGNQVPQFVPQNHISGQNIQMGAKKIILIPSSNINQQPNLINNNK